MLRRDVTGGPSFRATLYGRGRDIPEIETAIEFSDADYRWKVLGQAWQVADTVEQQAILDALHEADEPMKLANIAEALGKSKSNVANMLRKMVDAGLIIKPATGCYTPMKAVNPMNDGSDERSSLSSFSSSARDHAPPEWPQFNPVERLACGECRCDPMPEWPARSSDWPWQRGN